jgi:transposase-like protein
VTIHEWVHKADLQLISTVRVDRLAVDEKMIRLHGNEYWLSGVVDSNTNQILQIRLFQTAMKQTTQWLLTESQRRGHLDNVDFLVDTADYPGPIFDEDEYRFQMISHGNRAAAEYIF